jgi:hypothetical protein
MVYVDDGLMLTTSSELSNFVLGKLREVFALTAEENPKTFLGIDILRTDDNRVIAHQTNYAKTLIRHYGDHALRPSPMSSRVHTPFPSKGSEFDTARMQQFGKGSPLLNAKETKVFREIIGAMNWLATKSRPDLSVFVQIAARGMSNPTRAHLMLAFLGIDYLQNHMNLGIILSEPTITNLANEVTGAFVDANHGQLEDQCRPCIGVLLFVHGTLVHWKSSSLPIATRSTTESESRALSEAVPEIVYMRELLHEQGFGDVINAATPTRVDNTATISLANGYKVSKNFKAFVQHMTVVRDYVQQCIIEPIYIRSTDNHADCLTKALARSDFVRHRDSLLRVVPVPENTTDNTNDKQRANG